MADCTEAAKWIGKVRIGRYGETLCVKGVKVFEGKCYPAVLIDAASELRSVRNGAAFEVGAQQLRAYSIPYLEAFTMEAPPNRRFYSVNACTQRQIITTCDKITVTAPVTSPYTNGAWARCCSSIFGYT